MNKVHPVEAVYTAAANGGIIGQTRFIHPDGSIWLDVGCTRRADSLGIYRPTGRPGEYSAGSSGRLTDILYLCACTQRSVSECPSTCPEPKAQAIKNLHLPDAVGEANPKTARGQRKYSLRHIPLPAKIELCRALEDGVAKYGAANWRISGVPASVYVDACQRHLDQWYDGSQETASDSAVHNLGHAMACLAILIDAQANGKLIDDRPTPCVDTDALLLRPTPKAPE